MGCVHSTPPKSAARARRLRRALILADEVSPSPRAAREGMEQDGSGAASQRAASLQRGHTPTPYDDPAPPAADSAPSSPTLTKASLTKAGLFSVDDDNDRDADGDTAPRSLVASWLSHVSLPPSRLEDVARVSLGISSLSMTLPGATLPARTDSDDTDVVEVPCACATDGAANLGAKKHLRRECA